MNETKDLDQDVIPPKTEIQLLIFNAQTELEKKVILNYEYKFQDLLFAGILDKHISLIYTSRKAKGTVVDNFDLDGNELDFSLLSEEKRTTLSWLLIPTQCSCISQGNLLCL
ncbi:MAG: hypothetical protein R2799_10310 [Crocinitomicaceae bacterium]